ncbi:TorD/DmsD family molecular chaperone [Desulfosporosinus shakirovi]|uniref:TorD/DmsD family molecular chaperone n=1 Tax=Desulfosporosinus shakirovi TaxID=2885154 RepID=UPI001E5F1581|nr:molecular chaperone TorD family protein [Desulfosporosinus sp. SRJS8]MCB8816666.1 molecular chaperone TorD family protein [Desulfosporosinus sp. SRJS8]
MTQSADFQSESLNRAVLYNLFAGSLARKVDDSWLNPGFREKLHLGLPPVSGKEEVLQALTRAAEDPKYFAELQLDYDALFNVPGPKLTFPYESCYTHRNIDGTYGRLWQEPAQDMHRILEEWEIIFAEGWNLIPDHVAIELSFMAELCRRTGLAQEAEDLQRLQEWQREFFQAHLNSWLGEFVTVLAKKAGTEFYQGLAQLLGAFLEEEKEGLKAALELEK